MLARCLDELGERTEDLGSLVAFELDTEVASLHRLDLEPFILMNSSGEGKTLIEALEGSSGLGHYQPGQGHLLNPSRFLKALRVILFLRASKTPPAA